SSSKLDLFSENPTPNCFIDDRLLLLYFLSAPGGSGVGVVRATGDSYFLSADVSGFEPHEVVLLVYNQCVVIHAEKMAADGSVAGRFTHKSVLPADMDPLSVSSSLTAERLIISVGRSKSPLTSDLNTPQVKINLFCLKQFQSDLLCSELIFRFHKCGL
uniref:SHSP domain-containing protein n=1 Tax=Cyprinus carpio TaxID=7962 RepID=A0A8C1MHF3_CYPCA